MPTAHTLRARGDALGVVVRGFFKYKSRGFVVVASSVAVGGAFGFGFSIEELNGDRHRRDRK